MTECNQESFGFAAHFSRDVVVRFDGGAISSDAGVLWLRETDRRLGLLDRFAACFQDRRDPGLITHRVEEMLRQRVYALALGYEDLNDHEQLREDVLLGVVAGKREAGVEPLAGKSTLNRLELSREEPTRYKKIHYQTSRVDSLLVDVFLEAYSQAPESLVLDLDVTDFLVHGHQEKRFFHGYYDGYCYLPLYIFCGEHLLCARLRTADQDAAAGCEEEVFRIIGQIRQRWPQVKITLRADSGFCRESLMARCESDQVDYVLGLARNGRLRELIAEPMQQAARLQAETKQPARIFTEFSYQTLQSWSCARRVVAKAEQIEGKENPRFVVTSLSSESWSAQKLYEELYCARGDMENRIKEQLALFADRVSAETMHANQLRLYFSAIAYTLLHGFRRLGLKGTAWARAQVNTMQLHLLKIGAQIRITARKIWVSLTSAYPQQTLFAQIWSNLRC